jgi:hypothetical protein
VFPGDHYDRDQAVYFVTFGILPTPSGDPLWLNQEGATLDNQGQAYREHFSKDFKRVASCEFRLVLPQMLPRHKNGVSRFG